MGLAAPHPPAAAVLPAPATGHGFEQQKTRSLLTAPASASLQSPCPSLWGVGQRALALLGVAWLSTAWGGTVALHHPAMVWDGAVQPWIRLPHHSPG